MSETLSQIIAKMGTPAKPTGSTPKVPKEPKVPKVVQKARQTAVKRSPNPFVQAVEQAFKPTTPTKPQEPNLGQIIKQFKDVASSGRKQRGETLMQEYIRNTQPVSGNMGFKAGSGKGATIEAEMAAYDRKTFGAETYGKRPKGVSTAEWSKRQSHKGKFKQLAGTRNEQVAELDREIEAYKLENMTPVQRLELARETAGGLPGFYDKERASALAASLMGSQDLKDKTDASLFIRAANQVMQPVSTAYTVAMKDPRSLAEMPVGLQVGLSAGDLGAQIVGGFLTGGGSTPATASTLARIGAVATRSLALDAPGYIQMIEDAGGVDKALVAYKDMIGKALDPNSKISASERVNGIALAGMIVLSGGGKIAGKGAKPTPDLPTKPLDVEAPPVRLDLDPVAPPKPDFDPVADAYSKWQGMDGEEVPNAKAATKTIKPKPEAVPPSVESVRGEVGSVGLDAQPKVRGRKTEQATGSDVKPEAGRVARNPKDDKYITDRGMEPDEYWRILDAHATSKPYSEKVTTARQLLAGDDKAAKAFPNSLDVPISLVDDQILGANRGAYFKNANAIQIKASVAKDATQLREVLFHELAHAERVSKGRAVDMSPEYQDRAHEVSARKAATYGVKTIDSPTPKPAGNPSRGAGRAAGAKVADQPAPEPVKAEVGGKGAKQKVTVDDASAEKRYESHLSKMDAIAKQHSDLMENGVASGDIEKRGSTYYPTTAKGKAIMSEGQNLLSQWESMRLEESKHRWKIILNEDDARSTNRTGPGSDSQNQDVQKPERGLTDKVSANANREPILGRGELPSSNKGSGNVDAEPNQSRRADVELPSKGTGRPSERVARLKARNKADAAIQSALSDDADATVIIYNSRNKRLVDVSWYNKDIGRVSKPSGIPDAYATVDFNKLSPEFQQALKPTTSRPVPASVLADYPDLAPKPAPKQPDLKPKQAEGATAGMTREEIYASADLKARDAITKSLSSKRISDVLPDLRSKINTLDEQEALIYWQELGHESERLRNSNRTNGTYEVARDLLYKRLQSIRDGSVQQATQESITPTSSKRNRRSESGDASEPQGVVGSPGNGPIRREYFIEHDRHLNVDIRKRETEGHEHIIVHSAIAGRIPDPSVVPSYITSLQFVNGDDARAFAHARQWIEPWRGDNGDWYTAANRNTAAGLKSNTGVHADQAGNGPATPSPSRTAQTKAKLDEALENFKTEHGKLHAVSNPKQEAAKLASTVDLLKALLDHAAASAGEFVLKTADDFIKFTGKRLGRDLTEGEVARHKQAWEQVHKKAEKVDGEKPPVVKPPKNPLNAEGATGLARQFTDPERFARDLEETRAPAKSIQKLVDETQADWDNGGSTKADQALRRANDPEYAPTREQIVKDTAMVAHLKREVKNEYDKLLRKENLSGQDFADIQAVEAKLDEIDQYAQKIRTHWHDVGMALQIAYKPDFTVADLTMRARAAHGGDISPDAQAQIKTWVDKYEAAQKELDALRKAKPPKEVANVTVSKPRAARTTALNSLAKLGIEVRGEDGAPVVAQAAGGRMKGGKQAGAVAVPNLSPSVENQLRKSIRQIAKAYIVEEHPIAGSLDGVVELVRKHVPGLSEEDILRYLSDKYHRILLDSDLQQRESQAFMRRLQAAADYRNKTLLEKGFAQAGALLNTTQRGLQASMDLSAPFRQGRRVMVTKEWVNAWLPSTKAMFAKDPQKAMELHSAELARSPYYSKGVESGLGISSDSKPEEVWAGRLLQDWAAGKGLAAGKANPLRAYANLIQRSEAHYTIFLNDLRMRLFENLAKRNPNDKEYLESIAQMINVMTGRGHGKTATMLSHPAAGNVFYAPRYAWSEVQSTGMVPIWKTKSKMARQEAIKAYGRNFAVTVVGLSLARLFGNEVELDPRGTDFLKVRLQNGKVVDVLGASQQYLRLLVRMGYGSVSRKGFYSEPGAFGADPLMQAVNNKLSPAARSLLGLLRGWASPNADGDWQKQPPGMVLRDSVTPMGARKTGDQMWSDGDKWALLNLLGIDYEKGQPNKRQKKGSRPPKLEGLPQGMRQFAGHAPITGR